MPLTRSPWLCTVRGRRFADLRLGVTGVFFLAERWRVLQRRRVCLRERVADIMREFCANSRARVLNRSQKRWAKAELRRNKVLDRMLRWTLPAEQYAARQRFWREEKTLCEEMAKLFSQEKKSIATRYKKIVAATGRVSRAQAQVFELQMERRRHNGRSTPDHRRTAHILDVAHGLPIVD